MSSSISFKRKFFILKKEYSNMRNVNPKGHGKLELRNNRLNISLNIENAEKEESYNVILVGANNIYELGKIHTDNSHGGKLDFESNYKDIEAVGFPLEKINGILILKDTKILLGGYLDKDDKTIENYIEGLLKTDIKPQEKEIIPEETSLPEEIQVEDQVIPIETEEIQENFVQLENRPLAAPEDEVIFIENDLFIENDPFVENDISETIEETFEEEFLLAQEDPVQVEGDLVQLENHPPLAEEEYIPLDEPAQEHRPYMSPASVTEEEYDRALQEMFKDRDLESDYFQEDDEYIDTESQRKTNQKNQTTSYVLNILSFFPYIEPFKIDLMGYNWWQIAIDDPREDKGFLPYFSYIAGGNHKYPLVQNTVTARALMRKHGHYLFGLYNVDEEVKFYLYGVPGDFTIEDHPQRGSTGFNTWFEGKEGIGYWLLYIDPLTGRIIYPINPMIPKD